MEKRILVVDDDWDICTCMRELLENERFVVETASDGLDALEQIRCQCCQQERYNVILLDLTMPRMNGLQLIHVLRDQKAVLLDSIIVLSGDEDARWEARGLGIRHCLAKPFDLDVVLEVIATVLSMELFDVT